ncbi:hypothetical protein GVN21_16870 [Caulobacter sp. SLTY]|uniref:hypothetical protein n=1 Tax=Caulobacter sp. SLTY TaxID=2683262 RepID=UPI0014122AA0|nr:hypothetical protein [Caulobacter sp. SLTY]NBB17041.1 hypothetical protein [Caulobacter sp. SLTY]
MREDLAESRLERRAWLKLKPVPNGDFHLFPEGGLHHELKFDIENVGSLPALDVWVDSRYVIDPDPMEKPPSCVLGKLADLNLRPRRTVFPGEVVRLDAPSQLVSRLEYDQRLEPGQTRARFVLRTCIYYRSGSGAAYHQTGSAYEVQVKTKRGQDVYLNLAGLTVREPNISFVPVGGDYAD